MENSSIACVLVQWSSRTEHVVSGVRVGRCSKACSPCTDGFPFCNIRVLLFNSKVNRCKTGFLFTFQQHIMVLNSANFQKWFNVMGIVMQRPPVPEVQDVKVSRVLNTGTSSAIVPFTITLHTQSPQQTHTYTSKMVRACPHTHATDCTQKLTGTHKHHNHFSLVPICPVTTRKQIRTGLLDMCVCVCSNWGMRGATMYVCVRQIVVRSRV